jgi:hypothetical protein
MATLATIRGRVLAKLVDAGGSIAEPTAAQVTAEINSVIDFYEPQNLWFNETTVTGTLTVGSDVVPIPADFNHFLEPNALVVEQSNVRYPLVKISPLQYDSMYAAGTGLPRFFTYRNQGIQLYFIPDQEYPYRLYYNRSYADLVADGDSNDFTNYAERLIEYRTLAECYLNYRSDMEMAREYERKAAEELNRLVSQTRQRLATGNLETDDITRPCHGGLYYN